MEEAESLCDRIFLIKDGKKVTEGTVKNVIESSPTPCSPLWILGSDMLCAGVTAFLSEGVWKIVVLLVGITLICTVVSVKTFRWE